MGTRYVYLDEIDYFYVCITWNKTIRKFLIHFGHREFEFLVADKRLYKRLCPSVRWSVRRSVGEHESKSRKMRISAPAHPSATGIGCVSGLVHESFLVVVVRVLVFGHFGLRIKLLRL